MASDRPRSPAYRRLVRSGAVTARAASGQAALRRIAAVAAAGSPPETVFDTVTTEASVLLDGALIALTRFEKDGSEAVVVARTGGHVAVGTRLPMTGETTLARLWRTGRAERMDGYVERAGDDIGSSSWGSERVCPCR